MKLNNVVLTHPANFSDTGIKALVRCAEADRSEVAARLGICRGVAGYFRGRDQKMSCSGIGLDEPVAVVVQATTLKMIGAAGTGAGPGV